MPRRGGRAPAGFLLAAIPICTSCLLEQSRRLEVGYAAALMRSDGATDTYPIGFMFRAPVRNQGFLVGADPDHELYLRFGTTLQLGWSAPSENFASSVFIGRAFLEGDLRISPRLLVGTELGPCAVFSTTGGETEALGGLYLGLELSYVPEDRRNGVRAAVCWDWLSGSASGFSTTAGWILKW